MGFFSTHMIMKAFRAYKTELSEFPLSARVQRDGGSDTVS